MDLLQSLFPTPETSFPLLAVILGLPLLGALFNGLFGKRLGPPGVRLMALATVGGSLLGAVATFLLLRQAGASESRHVRFFWNVWRWLSLDSTTVDVSFSVDNLSSVMLLVVTGVGFLIHVYATGYMKDDPGYHRFFAYMNLFVFAMLVLVLGDSLPILFVGWEGVGLCSYLLIGFWFEDAKNSAAGMKAFLANRIGDFGLLVAMAMILHYVGSLSWQGMEAQGGQLLTPVQLLPFVRSSWLPAGALQVNAATVVGLLLMLGCAGKSAQIPLYIWLPDAMAGPTPVSALIHAATMVTAGVYLVARMHFIFLLSPTAMMVVAGVGALTALFAATLGLVQNDLKKILAYSTVSQLGYMFMGVGVGAFAAGLFHLVTHAFFKAALFLCAGCVIHTMHARIHDTTASQDVRKMGGLRKYMPRTFLAYTAATAAIIGFPLTSGFFSKDDILFRALVSRIDATNDLKVMTARTAGKGMSEQAVKDLVASLATPTWFNQVLFVLGLTAAVLTAFYMVRSWVLTFFGDFRGWKVVEGESVERESEPEHGTDPERASKPPAQLKGPVPLEAPGVMTWPVLILAALALTAGLLNAGSLHLTPWFEHWVSPTFASTARVLSTLKTGEALKSVEYGALGGGLFALVLGGGAAWWVYNTKGGLPARQVAQAVPRLYKLVLDKWRIDELYEATVIGFLESLAEMVVWFDKWIVDGLFGRVTWSVVALAGSVLRLFQNGKIQAYSAILVAGLLGVGAYLVLPHSKTVVDLNDKTGAYVLRAPPGMGYHYRWDLDGDGTWDAGEAWTLRASTDLRAAQAPGPGETRTVRVEVRNSFGLTRTEVITLTRPKVDKSGADRLPSRGVTP